MLRIPGKAGLVSLDQADYVITVNSQLNSSAWVNQLVLLKESQGLAVALFVVPDANWSDTTLCWSQKRIRDELMNAYFNGGKKMKYILLVGDANIFASEKISTIKGSFATAKNIRVLNF
jgi:hypothetical protein